MTGILPSLARIVHLPVFAGSRICYFLPVWWESPPMLLGATLRQHKRQVRFGACLIGKTQTQRSYFMGLKSMIVKLVVRKFAPKLFGRFFPKLMGKSYGYGRYGYGNAKPKSRGLLGGLKRLLKKLT
jgi:hypothetical protein